MAEALDALAVDSPEEVRLKLAHALPVIASSFQERSPPVDNHLKRHGSHIIADKIAKNLTFLICRSECKMFLLNPNSTARHDEKVV